jgi:hypothetical protein
MMKDKFWGEVAMFEVEYSLQMFWISDVVCCLRWHMRTLARTYACNDA